MNNIGYVMSGYDIYFGNPIPLYDVVDPGTRSFVFAAEYSGDVTPDNRSFKSSVSYNQFKIINSIMRY